MFYVRNKSRTVSVPTIPNKRPHAQKSILALNSFCVHPKARCIYQLCFIMVSNPVNPSSSRELISRKQRKKKKRNERKKTMTCKFPYFHFCSCNLLLKRIRFKLAIDGHHAATARPVEFWVTIM